MTIIEIIIDELKAALPRMSLSCVMNKEGKGSLHMVSFGKDFAGCDVYSCRMVCLDDRIIVGKGTNDYGIMSTTGPQSLHPEDTSYEFSDPTSIDRLFADLGELDSTNAFERYPDVVRSAWLV